jgi:GTP-dependent phosphoenolpyruvate carboxykinase
VNFDAMILVLQAAKAGKPIQFRIAGSSDEWRDTSNPHWNWEENDYRAKPELREFWVVETRVTGNHVFTDRCNAIGFAVANRQDDCLLPPIFRVREVLE